MFLAFVLPSFLYPFLVMFSDRGYKTAVKKGPQYNNVQLKQKWKECHLNSSTRSKIVGFAPKSQTQCFLLSLGALQPRGTCTGRPAVLPWAACWCSSPSHMLKPGFQGDTWIRAFGTQVGHPGRALTKGKSTLRRTPRPGGHGQYSEGADTGRGGGEREAALTGHCATPAVSWASRLAERWAIRVS